MARDPSRRRRHARRVGNLLGSASGEHICFRGFAGRKGVDAALRHATWRGRTGGFRLSCDRVPVRASDLRKYRAPTGSGDPRNKSPRPCRCGVDRWKRRGSGRSVTPRSICRRENASPSTWVTDRRLGYWWSGERVTEGTFQPMSRMTAKTFARRDASAWRGSDSSWWSFANACYLRLTLHEASWPEGAIVNELKLRIRDRDRMPIGQLEKQRARDAANSIRNRCSVAICAEGRQLLANDQAYAAATEEACRHGGALAPPGHTSFV